MGTQRPFRLIRTGIVVAILAIVLFVTLYFTVRDKPSDNLTKQMTVKEDERQVETLGNDADARKRQQLTLFGLSLNDSKTKFIRTLGNPTNEYFTDGAEDALLVLEFADCTVGFDTRDRAEFIVVTGPGRTIGLGSIAIGSRAADIITTLGEAETNNRYVLTYSRAQATLKFELDPEEQTVISIKLFRTIES